MVYSKGFETVITIGNDTPHLQSQHLLNAVHQLEQNDFVLGPSTDGGFYLMGLKQSHFNTETFLKLPWQTSELNRSISRLAATKNIQISYLEALCDIDTVSDIKTVFDSFKTLSKQIKQLLQYYISIETKIYSTIPHLSSVFSINRHFNKGPPAI